MRPFETCLRRIGRAEAHRDTIRKSWGRTVKKSLYSVGVGVDDAGTGIGAIWVKPTYGGALPDTFALELGEMLYQLRAALDACIYEAAILESGKNPPPDENKLEFPICRTTTEFRRKATFMLGPLAQKRRDFIESVQPYNVPETLPPELLVMNVNRCLGILNDWSRKDRHRRLHVLGSWASGANPKVHLPRGAKLDYIRVHGAGFLEKQSEIARFRIANYTEDMKVQANPDLLIDIAVDEAPPPCSDNDTLGNRINWTIKNAHRVIVSIAMSFAEDKPTVDFVGKPRH